MPRQSQHPRDKSGYLSEDTIGAIATAVGGPVGIVRVSGPSAFSALMRMTGEPKTRGSEPRKLYLAQLKDERGEALDEALFVRFVGPESFTGEDVVEFHIHGGAFLAQRILEVLGTLGVRQALPGEFSFRAVRNGKLTVSQAQAVSDLISAPNEGAIALALEKLSGSQNELLASLGEGLRELAALSEVGIDFADQDVEEVGLPALKMRLIGIRKTLLALEGSLDRGRRLQEGIRVAFLGLPNSGKSSFFNALLGEDRSIVSELAGTTRDVIRETLTLRGTSSSVTLRLEDTAGLRSASDHVEKIGVSRSLEAARRAELVLFHVDPGAPLDPVLDQWKMLGLAPGKTIGILTKADAFSPAQVPRELQEISKTWVLTSAKTGEGITEAIDRITSYGESLIHRGRGEVLLTRLDQADAIHEAQGHLERSLGAAEHSLFASDIRQALHSLGPLIGETPAEDILGRIFSSFCIGK
ncbi:MAG: tRNA uridine-5-carboxymethylaminomethyl(34) synthesis GTPase MnmE [Bdellovibrionota bacterium]